MAKCIYHHFELNEKHQVVFFMFGILIMEDKNIKTLA